jgi:RNA polymerase sigma factor (sigma-70 family)
MSNLSTDNQNRGNIISQYYNKIAAFIHRRVRSREDGEDILQNVFYHLARTDQLALPVDAVLPLLFRVARNLIIDFWRKRKGVLFSEMEDEETEEILSLLLSGEDDQPEWIDLQNLFWNKFRQALNELPPEQCVIFEQTELQCESFREIS